MTVKKRILEFILKPPLWLCIIVWVTGGMAIAGSITLYYLGMEGELWAISVHIAAFLLLVLSVYAVLTVIGIPERAKDSAPVKKFFSSYSTRAFVYATVSIIFNGCYVAFGIVMAVLTHSPWLGVLVGYHIFLLLPRLFVMIPKYMRKDGGDVKRSQWRSYAYSGLMLVLLALAILPVIRMTLDGQNSYNYAVSTVAYASGIALYTFIKFGIAVYNLKKVRGSVDTALVTVKNISFADALISLFALQAMMLKEFADGDTVRLIKTLNPFVGVLISAVICAMGIYMLVRGNKMLKKLDNEKSDADDKDRASE